MNAELYLECSAKYQENVEDVFREATKRALAFNRKQRNNKRKKKCIILWKFFFFFFKKDKKPQEPSSSVRQIVLSVLQRLKVGGLHMILQCYKEMSDDTTGKTILQVATWSLKHPLLEGFTFICYVWYFYVFSSSWGILYSLYFCTVILPKTYLLEAQSYCLYCDVAFTI